jgi:phosphatidate cytidylyltransferase
MTDDPWRRRGAEDDDFGAPLFDESTDADGSGGLSFGSSDTGPLPHWTEPPTGEIPRVLTPNGGSDPTDDLDVWSTFSGSGTGAGSGQGPSWRDDHSAPISGGGLDDITGLSPVFEDPDPSPFAEPAPVTRDESAPVRREPGRITIGTDPTDGAASRPASSGRKARPGDATSRPGKGARPGTMPPRGKPGTTGKPGKSTGGTGGRDMPTAIAMGLGIAAVFIGAIMFRPVAVAIIVLLVLGLAAVEYFDRVREKGYQPAFIPGLIACIAAPMAVYNYGVGSLPLVVFLSFTACAITFIGATSLESNPMPNMAITGLGITWIGILGSFGAAIVALSNLGGGNSLGTDTFTLLAIGVVANDVGALFVGSALGKTPLRHWISPNKSLEGFLGGTALTIIAMVLVGITKRSDTWTSTSDLLLLGIVISIMAPVGDLTESMFKRNLDVKDFGSIIKGHGGILDRFDGFLFVMPAVYYLTWYLFI